MYEEGKIKKNMIVGYQISRKIPAPPNSIVGGEGAAPQCLVC
jgi:hypothetical protein